MSGQNDTIRNVLEAALLVAGRVLSIKKLVNLFPEHERPGSEEISKALKELQGDYEGRGIELVQVGKGYRFQSRKEYAEWVSRLSEDRPARYSRALLETLAIIAYRQPVTRGDIEEIRGVSVSSDIVQKLSEREWVREVGHRDVPGRPALFGTTPVFLEHFGLKSLSELPPLSELRDLDEIGRELNFSLDLGDEAEEEESSSAVAEIEDGESVKLQASAPGADE